MSPSIDALQDYLRQIAVQQYETVYVPGFVLFFHPSDALTFFNYAIPGGDWAVDSDNSLARLRAEFVARDRRPRLEFIHEYAPRLGTALRAAGFAEQARQPLMIVQPAGFRATPPVPGLIIDEQDRSTPAAEVQTFLTAQRYGFDPDGAAPATEDEARNLADGLGQGRLFVARRAGDASGMPVGVGMVGSPLKTHLWAGGPETRIAEITGLATLASHRRQGIATALTARAVQTAFDRGADVVCLVAADERAGRVYKRVGFRPYATMLAYVDASEADGQETGF